MPLSDDEYDRLIYGATGKRPEPVRGSGDITEGENFARGFVQGSARNPMQAARQYSRGTIPLPDWAAPDPKYDPKRFSGMAGETVGTIVSAVGMMGAGEALLPEAITAAPFLGPAARGTIGGLSGLMSRPAKTPWEAGAQFIGGAIPGGFRGSQLQQLAGQARKLSAAEARARTLTGQARADNLNALYARQDAFRAPPILQPMARQIAADAARQAGLSESEVAQAVDNLQILRRSEPRTWSWIMQAPHGFHGMIWRALSGFGASTAGRAPGAVGAAAGEFVKGRDEQ